MQAAWHDYYGGALPLRIRPSALAATPEAIFAAAYCGCVITFFFVLVLFNFGLFFHTNEVTRLAEAALVGCAVLIWSHRRSGRKRPWLMPVTLCCAASVVLGALLGTYCYDRFGYYTFMYANSRIYHNVVPSESAAAMADAGRFVFAPEAWVDVSKGAGFSTQSGSRYCAAPIRGIEEPRRVEFWAVGRDCCDETLSFSCDAAPSGTQNVTDATRGDSSRGEHGGVIVFERRGLFGHSDEEQYGMARKKAEANAKLVSAEDYIYVRWVTVREIDRLTASYSEWAWLSIGVAVVLYAIAVIPVAWQLSKNAVKRH